MRIASNVLFGGALLLIGCRGANEPGDNDNVLIPLTLGNEWVYDRDFYDSTGSASNLTVSETLRVTAAFNIDSETWYYLSSTSGIMPGTNGSLYANRKDGLWTRDSARGANLSMPNLLLPTTRQAGYTYPSYRIGLTVHVDSLSVIVSTPSGLFLCRRFTISLLTGNGNETIPEYSSIIWMADNVGFVKRAEYRRVDSRNVLLWTDELTTFRVTGRIGLAILTSNIVS